MITKRTFGAIIASFLSIASYADKSGQCGENVFYTFSEETKTLTISGNGDMTDYEYNKSPFFRFSTDYFLTIQNIVIEEGVTSIGNYLFCECSVQSAIIPNSVRKIGDHAFSSCKNLVSLTIPNSVVSIGDYAFAGTGLTSIVLPNSITSISNGVFSECSNLVSATIPESIKSIGEHAFYSCFSMEKIELPDGITSIGKYAFFLNGFKNTVLTIPSKLISVGEGAFSCYNSSMTDVYFYGNSAPKGFSSCFKEPSGYSPIENVTLHVQDYAVESFKVLHMEFKDIVVFEKVTNFNLTYFVDDEEYKKEQHKYEDAITPEPDPTKKGMTFAGWSEIPEKMPGKDVTVTGIFSWLKVTEDGVIYEVSDTINNNAAVIGNDNANGELKIVSPVKFDYDYSITDIEDFSFKNNADITSVLIPESVRKIGDEAFFGCKNLAKIELGKSVNQIEPRAFAGIDKLTDVTIYAEDVPRTDRTAFENSYIEDYVTLHVPAGSVEKYKAAAPWKNFKEIVAIPGADIDDTDVDVVTIKSYGKGTYCSDYDLDFSYTDNLKAFIVTGYDHKTNTIWLTRVKSVPAGTGIIVKGTPGDYKVKHVESLSIYANFLVGTTEDKKIKDVEGEMTNFVLSKGEWYRFDGEITLPKGMAYLPLPLSKFAGTRSLIEVYEDNDEGTTEIRTIEQGTVSSEHDVWFNLQGQKVDKPGKGLYIKNGHKVVIK